MAAMLSRAAEGLLSELASFARASPPAVKKPPKEAPESVADEPEAAEGAEEAVALPTADDADLADVPQDPEALKEAILEVVREELGWDGLAGDPNEALAALEDSLADMFDADVEIVWNGNDKLTMRVEGEEPVALTGDYLGDLLEALAMQGEGSDSDGGSDGTEAGQEADAEEGDPQRGHRVIWQRSGILDVGKHLHAPKGSGKGGQFVSKGDGSGGGIVSKAKQFAAKTPAGKLAAGAAKLAPKTPAGKVAAAAVKVAAKTPAGKLAARAKGRAGRRAAAKAVGNSLSAGTGGRVKVSGNKDGTYNVGIFKKKMGSRKTAKIMLAVWMASAVGAAAVTIIDPLAVSGLGYSTYRASQLLKELRAGGAKA
jgi:hypothetical protein